MKPFFVILLTAIIAISLSHVVSANGVELGPYEFACDGPPTELEEYIGNEEYCYRVEISCPEAFRGFLGMTVNRLDGGVGGFGGVNGPGVDGIPENGDEEFCDMGFGHLRNKKIEHSCELLSGSKFELKIKRMGNGNKCL